MDSFLEYQFCLWNQIHPKGKKKLLTVQATVSHANVWKVKLNCRYSNSRMKAQPRAWGNAAILIVQAAGCHRVIHFNPATITNKMAEVMEHKHTNHSTTRETMKAAEMKKQEISTYNIKHVIAVVADWSIFKLASNYQRSNRSFPLPLDLFAN